MEENLETQKSTRIMWVDCAKAVAIFGVVADHCNGVLYQSPVIAQASYFAVSLFVILAGMSAVYSMKNRDIDYRYQLKRIGNLYLKYAVATFLLLIWYSRFFDLKTYVTHLLNFSIEGSYYFWLFFFQLLLISPVLLRWKRYCETSAHCNWLHIATLLFLGWMSSICIRYTNILPVHGGGKFLFGGTYLMLYYLGMVLAESKVFRMKLQYRIIVLACSAIFAGTWVVLKTNQKIPFDTWLMAYWGEGFNPPSVMLMVYAIVMLFICYTLFATLEEWGEGICKRIINMLSAIGRNTLYIFMYHLVVRSIILTYWPQLSMNRFVYFLFVVMPMIWCPVIIMEMLKKVWKERISK